MIKFPNGAKHHGMCLLYLLMFMFKFVDKIDGERVNCQLIIPHTHAPHKMILGFHICDSIGENRQVCEI